MLVSVAWLREIVGLDDAQAEIARLLTARGLTVDAIQQTAAGDAILDIDVPANRPDRLGHVGIAREWAAARGRSLPPRSGRPPGAPPVIGASVSVRIEAPDLCTRYVAALVRGVHVGVSS